MKQYQSDKEEQKDLLREDAVPYDNAGIIVPSKDVGGFTTNLHGFQRYT